MQFRRDSPSEDIFVLPQIPANARNTVDRRIISTLQMENEQSKRLMTSIDHESPVRHSMDNNQIGHTEVDEMKHDMFKTSHRERSHNMHSARQVFQNSQGHL